VLAAEPRFAGTESESRARAFCGRLLSEGGFTVTEEAFAFSRFPAEVAPSLLSGFLAFAALGAGHIAFRENDWKSALLVAIGGLIASSLIGRWLLQTGIFQLPSMRTQSTNLIAKRSASPSVWLVAHIDSKSQTIPMLVRVASVVLSSVFYLLMLAALAVQANAAALIASLFCALSLLPLILCFISNRSNGALDNASGLAAVLLAAQRIPERVGVVITSGEELGLAGARAFAASRASGGIALNCDTIDDAGQFMLIHSGGAARTLSAVRGAASRLGIPVRNRRMIPGILADHIAFSEAGWDSCTLVKGNLGTLRAVHTSGDRNTSIDGTGIALAADILVAAVEELT